MIINRSKRAIALVMATLSVVGVTSWKYVGAQRGGGGGGAALTEPFKGVTTNGVVVPNLFPVRATGVSTAPVVAAAERFLAALTTEQRGKTTFAVDAAEWRDWNNVHRYARQGVSFKELTESQRGLAFGLLRASLSAHGFDEARNIMRLNGYLADVLNNPQEYGEFLYHLTVMGPPHATEPWGWQIDGHHLIVNYFVMGDQVVITPTFMGSEPVAARIGNTNVSVLQGEQDLGVAFAQTLTAEQRRVAVIQSAKTMNNAQGQAFRDNLVLEQAGIRGDALTNAQRVQLLGVVREYVRNMPDGHARVRMEDVERHINATYFAWVGDIAPNAVFYYRIQSPVLLVEFDHQTPVALQGPRQPVRSHIHTVVRTPNGNDYGKDLLRQHYEQHRNDPAHGHAH